MAEESIPAETVAVEDGPKNFNNRGNSELPSEYDTNGDENASKEVEELPYCPTNVFSKLGYAFDQQLESKSWAERKRALDQLLDSLEVCGDLDKQLQYADLLTSLKHIIEKDANLNVVTASAKCITILAQRLGSLFFQPQLSSSLVLAIGERFKEKRAIIRDPLVSCINAVFATTDFVSIKDEIIALLGKPNPGIKTQMDMFLYRIFRLVSPSIFTKDLLKELMHHLVKHASDSDKDVRDASYAAHGSLMNCIGEQALSVLLPSELKTDKVKYPKILEYKEKAHSEAQQLMQEQNNLGGQSNLLQNGDGTNIVANPPQQQMDQWDLLDPVDILKKLPKDFQGKLASENWKERLECLEGLHQLLGENPRLSTDTQYSDIVTKLSRVLKNDANINVAACAIKCLAGFANGLRANFSSFAPGVVSIIFERIREKKVSLRDPLRDSLDCVFATTSLASLSKIIVATAESPNPDIRVQLFQFLTRVFDKITQADLPRDFLSAIIVILNKQSANHPSVDVRRAAATALASLKRVTGSAAETPSLSAVGPSNVLLTNDKPKQPVSRPSTASRPSLLRSVKPPTTAPPSRPSTTAASSASIAESHTPKKPMALKANFRRSSTGRPLNGTATKTPNRLSTAVVLPTSSRNNNIRPSTSSASSFVVATTSKSTKTPLASTMKKSAGVQTTPSISGQHSAVKFNAINNAQENPTKPRQRYEFVNVDGPNGSRLPRLVPVPDDYVIGTGEPAAADLQGKKELLDK